MGHAHCTTYFAHGALVGAMGLSSPPSLSIQGALVGDMFADGVSPVGLAHGARVTGIGPNPAIVGSTRNVSTGACRSVNCEGVQVIGKSFEKTKCWTTCRLSMTSP